MSPLHLTPSTSPTHIPLYLTALTYPAHMPPCVRGKLKWMQGCSPAALCASNMAHLLRAVPEIPQEAEKTRDAIRFVRVAEEACGGDGLREALGLLHMPDAQSAAHALIALGDVAKNCDKKEALAAVKDAERATRDVVVLRCCDLGGGLLNVAKKEAFFSSASRILPSPSIFAALASATQRTESSDGFCSWRIISCGSTIRSQLPETHLKNKAQHHQTDASIGIRMPSIQRRLSDRTPSVPQRSQPASVTRRSAVTGTGCEGKPMDGCFSACDGCFLPECWRFSS